MTVQTLFNKLSSLWDFAVRRPGSIESDMVSQRIPFDFIAAKIREVVRRGSDKIGRKTIVPNTYIVKFSPEDRACRRQVEEIFVEELREIVRKEISRLRGVIPHKYLSVTIDTDGQLEKGRFYIDCIYREYGKNSGDKKQEKLEKRKSPELSKTLVPPSDEKEMRDGTFLQTLLKQDNAQDKKESSSGILCRLNMKDSRGRRTVYLPAGTYVAGRSADADIRLDPRDLKISREHVCFDVMKKNVSVRIVGKNGGKINDRNAIAGTEHEARHGDRVCVGGAELTLNLEKG